MAGFKIDTRGKAEYEQDRTGKVSMTVGCKYKVIPQEKAIAYMNIAPGFLPEMREWCGKIVTVSRINPTYDDICRLVGLPFWWHRDWLLPINDGMNIE